MLQDFGLFLPSGDKTKSNACKEFLKVRWRQGLTHSASILSDAVGFIL